MPVMMRARINALTFHAHILSTAPANVTTEHVMSPARRPMKSERGPKVTMPKMAPAYMADLMNSFWWASGFMTTA